MGKLSNNAMTNTQKLRAASAWTVRECKSDIEQQQKNEHNS